ncbi:DUF1365 domain-containing protein [Patulibacter defluvii]|uniref:DUF1365 domain-containing protein n=1 Tax=Patulibacter defluvii TaxID=3095358 RepID=UPI002A74C0CB|nr:DUF1365 domain-containing protein [Patulibacter sp. DM4]
MTGGEPSAVYLGRISHRRHAPQVHAFSYPTAMLYVSLEQLPDVLERHRGWGVERRAPLAFRRRDHHGDPAVPLDEAIRRTVATRCGRRPRGPVRLLFQPRLLGRSFNPVTFAYCFGDDGVTLEAVLAEVTNTPWGERHAYVLDAARADREGDALAVGLDKAFHVSPFMAIDHRYRWRTTIPGPRLRIHLASERDGRRIFDAGLDLDRRPLDAAGLRAYLRHQPLGPFAVLGRIYGQALRLAARRVPIHPHPDRQDHARR